MMTKSNIQVKAAFIRGGSLEQIEANHSQVPCDSALQLVRREILQKLNLAKDDSTDVFLRSRGPLKDFIRHLDVVEFCAYLMKDIQVNTVVKWHHNTSFRLAYIDATGSIVRPLVKGEPILQDVTDKSFANIGAILRAFNNMTLTEYLHNMLSSTVYGSMFWTSGSVDAHGVNFPSGSSLKCTPVIVFCTACILL